MILTIFSVSIFLYSKDNSKQILYILNQENELYVAEKIRIFTY